MELLGCYSNRNTTQFNIHTLIMSECSEGRREGQEGVNIRAVGSEQLFLKHLLRKEPFRELKEPKKVANVLIVFCCASPLSSTAESIAKSSICFVSE